MPANTQPIFPLTPHNEVNQVSVANTNRDGTGTLVTVWTPGANGSVILKAYIKAIATTTAGLVRLFVYDGANNRLLDEIAVTAIVPSGTVAAFVAEISILAGTVWKSGILLKAATNNAETFNIHVEGGDY